jgi:CubicO group peptidase (beta-lactamase class C family)
MGGPAPSAAHGCRSLTITVVAPESVGLSSERLHRLDRWTASLVADRKLAGALALVARRGQVALLACHGMADIERAAPLRPDSVFRIYSMTKPLTSLAVLMLYEEGHFQLDDPITRFLPAFGDMRVYAGGSAARPATVPALRDITFADLLTHRAGLTYGFIDQHPVDAMYRAAGLDNAHTTTSLEVLVERLSRLPLLAQPGTQWNYSVATDLLGHLVAVISGQGLDAFLRERVLTPLGMHETGFVVTPAQLDRFTSTYTRPADGSLRLIDDARDSPFADAGRICSGGGGLVSTAADYLRFCQLMLGKGSLGGVRLIGRKTVELMTADHVGEAALAAGLARLGGTSDHGRGFGLGFSVMLDPARAQILGSPGEVAWSGAASTSFFIDHAEDLAVIFMTQFMPSNAYRLNQELRVLCYQAIVD